MHNLLKVKTIQCPATSVPITTPLSFTINTGEIGVLLGDRNSAGSTILRAIKGLLPINRGKIILAGNHISAPDYTMRPEQRNCSIITREPSLIPHLSLNNNIQLAIHTLKRRERVARAQEVLKVVDLMGYEKYRIEELPDEEIQRATLARALITEPTLLLWDEPFAKQPSAQRMGFIDEVEEILRARKVTTLIVTESLQPAQAIADTMGVLQRDALPQWDSPINLYYRPNNRHVASNTGNGALIEGFVHPDNSLSSELGTFRFDGENREIQADKPIEFLLRPDHLLYDKSSVKFGTIIKKRFQGAVTHYTLRLEDGTIIPTITPSQLNLTIGKPFHFKVAMESLIIFRAGREHSVNLGKTYSI